MRHALAAVAAVLTIGAGQAAQAQSFDCAKAKTPVELAICASPGLRDQDRAMAEAFTAALTRDPAKAEDLRKAQRAWLANRGKACVTPDAASTKITACLIGLYRSRLAALQVAPGPIPSLEAAGRAPSPGPGPTLQPQLQPQPAIAAALLPRPVVTMPVVPALPQVVAGAGAALSRPTVSAGAPGDALLSVAEAGRFALRAESATGVALQLVDMATGPGDTAGEAGQRDGRLDVLLDRGTYKLRSTGATGATGEAKLSVVAFREAAPASTAMFYGGEVHGTLADLEQRSFWVATAADGQIAVEAIGRSLADMRLWLNGTDLAAVTPEFRLVEPKPGRPAMRARLSGRVEPGIYLVTTYGGPAQKWGDGDTAQALHVRSGPPESVAAGWLEGTIGPFGTARFVLPGAGGTVRLELPEPAPARIALVQGGTAAATIARNSREPVASITAQANPREPAVVEVTGQEGQPFRLRVLRPSGALRFSGTGPHLVSAEVAGEGGDEFPAAAVLVRFEGARGQVMAAVAPQVGPAQAWRRKFNFRGTTATPFEVTAAMALALRSQGPAIKATIEPLAGGTPPRTGAAAPLRWELEPGWYTLRIEPVGGSSGVLDLTLGPQGLQPELAPAAAPRAALALGTVTLDRTAGYGVFASSAPGLIVAPVARPLPAMLEGAPLLLVQEPGQVLSVPVRMPARGALAVAQPDGVPVPVELSGDSVAAAVRSVTLRVPGPERRRSLIVSWSDPQTAVPAAAKLASLAPPEPIAAGTPRHFDLNKDETRSFQLGVAEGGLYRLETLGRLKTTLALATAFQPGLGSAEANGAGQNALLQSYLRAGRYRVIVGAKESTGRLGLTAVPAALDGTATLTSGGSVRAALAGGRGLVVPVEIATAGTYRLILDGLDRTFSARLEDAEGWPLTAPGPLDRLERQLNAGRYRLVVMPEAVDARAVVRLDPVIEAVETSGHGPHRLAFGTPGRNQWREPAGRDDPRAPDAWNFALAGPAAVTLDISDGMAGELFRVDGERRSVARIVAKAGFAGTLEAGRYLLEARGQGRNDRLDYTVTLATEALQPDAPRRVSLPATVPFAIAQDRVVNLTSFGNVDLRAILRDSQGRVVERLDDRTGDWNIALSRLLPAGQYTLELSAVETADAPASGGGSEGEGQGEGEAGAADGDGEGEGESDGETEDAAATGGPLPEGTVELRLTLPEVAEHDALAPSGTATVAGPQVHRFALPAAGEDGLMVVAARAAAELVVSLEIREADGSWRSLGQDRGLAPVVAIPAGNLKALPRRAAVWAVDGGTAPAVVALRIVRAAPQAPGPVSFAPITVEGLGTPLHVARVTAPGAGLLAVAGEGAARLQDLLEGSRDEGDALAAPTGPLLVPQSERVWIASRAGTPAALALTPSKPEAGGVALVVPAGGSARLPAAAVTADHITLWRAETPFGQPGLDAGRGMGIGTGSVVALGADTPVRGWNAADDEALRVRIEATSLTLAAQQTADGTLALVLPPKTAVPVRLPAGAKRLAVDLPAGAAAVAGWRAQGGITVWTGSQPVTRSLEGDWTEVLLANPSAAPLPARLALAPSEGGRTLATGAAVKRFFGAAGSFTMAVDGQPGDRLIVAGANAVFAGKGGRVAQGRALTLSGAGLVTVSHPAGLVALWLERAGTSPWPAATPVTTALPGTRRLDGTAMRLAVAPETPVLLSARTTGPVIAGLVRGGVAEAPDLFPAGAAFHRYLPAGASELALLSPNDGPLSGTLELTAEPVTPLADGIGAPVVVAPGGTALFGFTVTRKGPVGAGIRAEPDQVAVRLLDAEGHSLGTGVAQLHDLAPGRYLLEARVPPDGTTTTLRPAVLGLTPPPAGPPADVAQSYLDLVGLAPAKPR